eukprot:4925635-Amphidinium_carterae.1
MHYVRSATAPVLRALLHTWFLAQVCEFSVAAATKVCYAYFGYVNDLGFTYSQNLARAWVDVELGTSSRIVEGVGFMSREEQDAVIESFLHVELCPIIATNKYLLLDLAVDHA